TCALPIYRHRGRMPGRALPAQEPRQGHGLAGGQAAGPAGCRGAQGNLRHPQAAGGLGRPLRAHPHLQLPAGPGDRSPHQPDPVFPGGSHGRGGGPGHRAAAPGIPGRPAGGAGGLSRFRWPTRGVDHRTGMPEFVGRSCPAWPPGSPPTAMSDIQSLLAAAELPDSPSPRLDAELLLAHVLGRPRSFLRTWPEHVPSAEQCAAFAELLARRRAGEPVAYLLARQGLWSLGLEVSPDTRSPRPDTELRLATALQPAPATPLEVLDLGTGTGAIALALAAERPAWTVTGVDRVEAAVALASRNGERLGLRNARFEPSHWFSALGERRFGLIVSNPPYIAADDRHLGEGDVRFEPASALVAEIGRASCRERVWLPGVAGPVSKKRGRAAAHQR